MKIATCVNCFVVLVNVALAFILIDSIRINNDLSESRKQQIIDSNYELTTELHSFVQTKELEIYSEFSGFKNQVVHELTEIFTELNLNRQAIGNIQATLQIKDVHDLIVTAYTPSLDETDDDPTITAAMLKVKPGMVAVSRDLFKQGWTFGKKIYVEGMGIYMIADLMDDRWEKRIDILFFDKKEANHFGKRSLTVALLTI